MWSNFAAWFPRSLRSVWGWFPGVWLSPVGMVLPGGGVACSMGHGPWAWTAGSHGSEWIQNGLVRIGPRKPRGPRRGGIRSPDPRPPGPGAVHGREPGLQEGAVARERQRVAPRPNPPSTSGDGKLWSDRCTKRGQTHGGTLARWMRGCNVISKPRGVFCKTQSQMLYMCLCCAA